MCTLGIFTFMACFRARCPAVKSALVRARRALLNLGIYHQQDGLPWPSSELAELRTRVALPLVNNTDSISKSDSWCYGALLPSRVASDDDTMSCIAV